MEAPRNTPSRPGPDGPSALPADPRAWRQALPVLTGFGFTLREPAPADAASLLMALAPHDLRECGPLPATPTIAGMEALVAAVQARREAGTALCWAVVPAGAYAPVGLIVVQPLDYGFTMASVSAAIAPEFRGTGLFQAAARGLLDYLLGPMGIHRVEMRVDVRNARANGALRKLGAAQEGVLRRAQFRDGAYRDHVLWAVVAGDWRSDRDLTPLQIH